MDAAKLTGKSLTRTSSSIESTRPRRCRCGTYLAATICGILKQGVFRNSFKIALPCALAAAGVKFADLNAPKEQAHFLAKLGGTEIYSSCTFLIGMLLLFRTSQAYARYWDGVDAAYAMMADFCDVVSQAIAFCKTSEIEKEKVSNFEHILVRLMSLLHAFILAELEAVGGINGSEHALNFELVDAQSLDKQSLLYIQESDNKVHLVSQWIKGHLVDAIDNRILDVPTPLSTRLFEELNSGQCHYHKALKIADTPFPFPYTAASQICLILHWCITPFVVGTWTDYPWYSAFLTFMQVFILWALDSIALEIENPFEQDLNDLDVHSLHKEFNERLIMLLEPASRHTPRLGKKSVLDTRLCRSSTQGFLQVSASRLSSCALDSSEDEFKFKSHISTGSTQFPDIETGLQEFEPTIDGYGPSLPIAMEWTTSKIAHVADDHMSDVAKECPQSSGTKQHFEAALFC